MLSFYEALEIAMAEKGMKPSQVCAVAGMHQSYISKLKSGAMKHVEWDKAVALILALGMTPSEFYEIQKSGKYR